MKIWEILIIIGVILIWIFLSPIWIPIYVQAKLDDLRFAKYLRTIEGAKYFCYTTKQGSQEYVKNNILPFLSPDVEVLHVTTKMFNLGKDEGFPNRIVATMKALKKGFPCIAKVSNGKLVSESINHELYRAIARKKEADQVLRKINRFFMI